ncbi:ABC transporter, membrane spanning protein (Oligopeptide) [Desulfamplus magnetovallimortis]|uniref:ABC transporter, membrane spanning protein (Oligopeptide) n=1 Tax=Desulfamplus magnetovallimortis TaxID=1246637 RepID=A0A1W1HJ19_9BACT|nr:ABC transporter permease [Desulfamplus magnetovallimortis]SLM32454.1 ABC transporter, membrane spanning protein (Oligopeptide) [Desulfamplus magnetovallimortis]
MKNILLLICKRIGASLITIFVISLIIFIGVELLPGDVAETVLGQSATPETVEAFRKELKLDLPPHVRYATWLNHFVHGDFGNSLANKRPVAELVNWRLSNTLLLAMVTAFIAVPLSIFLGILAALYRNTLFDKMISITTLSFISFPEFFIAYVLIALFSVQLNIFPSLAIIDDNMGFFNKLYAIILPSLTLTCVVTAHMMRQTRAAIINVLGSAYIEMAEIKGIRGFRIIVYHAFPNALSPVINVVAVNLAYLVVGVVLVEVVFVYPGLGQLLVDSVAKRDLPVVQASGLIFSIAYIFMNLAADILSMLANPKLRQSNF